MPDKRKDTILHSRTSEREIQTAVFRENNTTDRGCRFSKDPVALISGKRMRKDGNDRRDDRSMVAATDF
jgi:hypothetical protein